MKKYLLTIILLFITAVIKQTDAAPQKVFIKMSSYDDKGGLRAAAVVQALDISVSGRLKKDYPCLEYFDINALRAVLNWERGRQLLGSADEQVLQNIGSAAGCKYLIALNVKVLNDQALISVIFMDYTKAKTLSRAFETVPYGDAANDAVEKVTKTLFDGLKTYEICPFKGPVNVNIVGTTKDNQTEEYPVYCNGGDGQYRKTTTLNKYSENEWSIQKNTLYSATGNVKFNLSEELTIDEDNWCYECGPNKQGPRTYFGKLTTYADIQGLSNESESNGINVDDARVEITFLDDGTYTLRVKATSTQGEKKTKKEVHAEGVCKNINDKPETITKKLDAGINEIFGPFTGTAQDKVLSQKNTIKRINPINEEEETITYEFNLTRD
jgi:hypothetical protein